MKFPGPTAVASIFRRKVLCRLSRVMMSVLRPRMGCLPSPVIIVFDSSAVSEAYG